MFIDDFIKISLSRNSRLDQVTAYALSNSLRFQVDNVARYVHENRDDNREYCIEKHIPNIAPLAPYMWFEYSGLAVGKGSTEKFGCLLSIDYGRKENIRAVKYRGVDVPEHIHWFLRAEYFVIRYFPGGEFELGASDWVYCVGVDEEGKPLGAFEISNRRFIEETPDENERCKWHEELLVALTAICFAHCKGAEIKEHQPSRQVRRHAERKGEPITTHHTIDIRPATRVLHEEGDVTKNGLGKALHICRGHFAHYTAEKPLFGKYVGTVYKPMHVRGSTDEGTATKDYRVHAESRKSGEGSAIPV